MFGVVYSQRGVRRVEIVMAQTGPMDVRLEILWRYPAVCGRLAKW